jgi:hypothetical protein
MIRPEGFQHHHGPTFDHDEIVKIAGVNRTFRIALLNAGPHSLPHAAIIPEASVIQAAHYPAIPQPDRVISFGDTILVAGMGHYRLVKTGNADWPILVPRFGPRYYVDFAGQGNWKVLDRLSEGSYTAIPQDVATILCVNRYGPRTHVEALAVAALMSMLDERADGVLSDY